MPDRYRLADLRDDALLGACLGAACAIVLPAERNFATVFVVAVLGSGAAMLIGAGLRWWWRRP